MRVLVIDTETLFLDFVLRAAAAGHDVRWYRHSPRKPIHDGDGFAGFQRVTDWRAHMAWAREGLIVNTGNAALLHEIDRYRELPGYDRAIFGPSVASARLEIDRGAGMEAFKAIGVDLVPYQTVASLDEAEAVARRTDRPLVFKPAGSTEDKSATYVAKDPADLVGWIRRKKARGGLGKGPFMLQDKLDMVGELSVAGWFGPEGFLPGKWNVCAEFKKFMAGDIGMATGEMGCYSADTEVLTSLGWKAWPDVVKGDELATLVNGELRFEVPSALVSYEMDGPMISWANQSVDIMVTPNHNMFVSGQHSARRKCPDFKFVRAEDCTESQYLLARTAKWEGASPAFHILKGNQWHTGMGPRCTEDVRIPFRKWCQFLGIWFAEGSVTDSAADIAQSHPGKVAKVRALLEGFPIPFIEKDSGFRINSRSLVRELRPFGRSYEKRVPDYIKNAAPEEILAFLDAFAVGDAWTEPNGARCFYTSNPGLADDLQDLMLRCGRLGIVKQLKPKKTFGFINGRPVVSRRPAYVVFERARKVTGWLDSRDRKELHYRGKVYCATVSNHVLFVRRNGKPVWCGNSVTEYVRSDKLAAEVLEPLAPILRTLGHRGDICVSGGMDARGRFWPFELTCRFGYPAWFNQSACHRGDPVEWMRDLLAGRDTLRVSHDVCVSVVMGAGRFPHNATPPDQIEGLPISGVEGVIDDLHLCQVMRGMAPVMQGGEVVDVPTCQVAGEYVAVATGTGPTVEAARKSVYATVDAVAFPDKMYRNDIGCSLRESLPKFHAHGYYADMRYD